MLRARFFNAASLKKVLAFLKRHGCGGLIQFLPTEMRIRGVKKWLNEDNVADAVVCFLLKNDEFAFYQCDQEISRVIDVEYLEEMLGTMEDDVPVTVSLTDARTLSFSSSSSGMDTTFRMMVQNPHPSFDPSAPVAVDGCEGSIKMSSAMIEKLFSERTSTSSAVILTLNEGGITFGLSALCGTMTSFVKLDSELKTKYATALHLKSPTVSVALDVEHIRLLPSAAPLAEFAMMYLFSQEQALFEFLVTEGGRLRITFPQTTVLFSSPSVGVVG